VKYLVAGLGNIGKEYDHTRHNIGFMILDALASASNIVFEDRRYGFVAEYKFKGRTFVLLRPTTFVNLSGRAVSYWLKKENIPLSNLLVICDDLALPFGTIRVKAKGSDGGHNGLRNINEVLGSNEYARLRFGIGDNFHKGYQVDYVLGKWNREEDQALPLLVQEALEVIRNFGTLGIERTMNLSNTRKGEAPESVKKPVPAKALPHGEQTAAGKETSRGVNPAPGE
jgi:PTH1 family peptidyl-tRNA hydrolase